MARPSTYDPKYHPKIVKYMTRTGMTMTEVAEDLGIAEQTLFRWKKKYPELEESLKENTNFIDSLVEDSLLKRALGYEITETEETRGKNGEVTRTKTITKKILPDTTAMIFWLKNRQRARWKDKWEIDFGGESEIPVHIHIEPVKPTKHIEHIECPESTK
jgi:transposase-like protein